MASYTIELRKICELYGEDEVRKWFEAYNLDDYLTKEQQNLITTHGLWSKEKLSKKIINHYYTREIAFETPRTF